MNLYEVSSAYGSTYVVAGSFTEAEELYKKKYDTTEVKEIKLIETFIIIREEGQ